MAYPQLDRLSPSAKHLGYWSAVFATLFSLAYIIAQLAEWLGWLGSAGGPHSSSTPLGLVLLLTPSLLLCPSFLLMIVSLHDATPPERKVFSLAALAFATIYSVLIGITYYVQLAWITPRIAAGRTAGIEPFLFVPFDSFLYAVDILGYSFMSASTLFAAMALTGEETQKWARRFLFANGLLIPFLALQMFWHNLIWIASLWAITFPAATWSVAILFRRAKPTTPGQK